MAYQADTATFESSACAEKGSRSGNCSALRVQSCVVAIAVALATPGTAQASDGALVAESEAADEIIVTGEKMDTYDVLPDRASSSVFGTSRELAETPRSVTLVESSLIDLYGVRSVNDFVNITAGTYTGNYFGVAGALDVRGERADNFFRGFRRIENRGNFPTAVTASDYVEIIKGPPPLVYGGGKVGGILNFVPKSGQTKSGQLLGKWSGELSLTGGTYDKKIANIELGGPFSIGNMPSSVYVSAQIEDSGSYYRNIYNKNKLVQAALNTDVSDSIRLEYGGMYQDADLNQSLGWNRVTQALIDSKGGSYLAGRPTLDLNTNGDNFLSPSEISAYALEQFAFANPFPFGALSANQVAAFALNPATVGLTRISHRTIQAEKSDFSRSKVATGYFDIVWRPSDDVTIKNQSFYDNIDHLKYSSYGFTAKYTNEVFENKTSATFKFEPSDGIKVEPVLGISYRIASGHERESRGRGFQVLDRRDISFGATPNDRFEGAHTGSGNVPYNWDQDGRHTDLGLFAVVDTRIGDSFSIIAGGRMDRYTVRVRGTDLGAVFSNARDSKTAWSYNGSASYEVVEDVNLYITHAKSSYVELGQGGVIDILNVLGDTWVQPSKMTEVGIKGYLNYGRIYFNLLGYKQEKTSFNSQAGAFDFYRSKGIELEVRGAVTPRLSLTGSATLQKSELLNAPFFLGVSPSVLGLDPVKTYGGRFVAVGALIGFNGPITTPTPEYTVSMDATYTHPQGFGFSLGATHIASMFAGYTQTIKLPSYTTMRAAAFVRLGDFEARVNVSNLTNTKYYSPQFLFWDSFVSPSIGRTAELTLSMKF